MNRSVCAVHQQSLGRAAGMATGKTLHRAVLGLAVLALIAGASLAVVFLAGSSEGPQLASPDVSPQSYGSLSEAYAPMDAQIAGIGSDCCSHVAEYQFAPPAGNVGGTAE